MTPVEPRAAATVILLRDVPSAALRHANGKGFELLMVARNPAGRVMGGVWAFPGGALEREDGDGEAGLRAAAIRELAEETGISGLTASELVPFARWIAPISLPFRFDTTFFLARAPAGSEPDVDGVECVDAGWFSPAAALAGQRAGSLPLLFPTRKQLERMGAFATIDGLLAAAAAAAPVEPVRPRLREPGDPGDALLPGDPGYETASG
jgi:8-oxo-dGTP pyrophosphatase MutT (NUDIX family)